MANELNITPAQKRFLSVMIEHADAGTDAASADAVQELAVALQEANDAYESKAGELLGKGEKMLAIFAACATERDAIAKIEAAIKEAGASDGERWANRVAFILNVVLSNVDGLRPESVVNVNGGIPPTGDATFDEGKGKATATGSPRGKQPFLRVVGTGESFYRPDGHEGRWATATIGELIHDAWPGVRLRYPTRADFADEVKTGKNGEPNFVQKVHSPVNNLPRVLADRFDRRFYAVPLPDDAVIEYGDIGPDGEEQVKVSVVKVDASKLNERQRTDGVRYYAAITVGDDTRYLPLDLKGSVPTHLKDNEAAVTAFMDGFPFPPVGRERVALQANGDDGDGEEELAVDDNGDGDDGDDEE